MQLRFAVTLAAQCALAAGAGTGFNYQLQSVNGIAAVAVDAAGNTYLTGATSSSTFLATPGVFQPRFGGGECSAGPGFGQAPVPCSDAFVAKLDPSGALVWATYLGGSGSDAGTAIAVDAAGNVYVAGQTVVESGISPAPSMDDFPTTPGSAFPTGNGGGFMVKISPNGSQLIYGTYIPGIAETSMAIDSTGSAYVAGYAEPASFDFPTTAGAFQASSIAGVTGLVVKLNPAGSALVYATYLGGTGAQDVTQPFGIAVDAARNAYVTGTATPGFPTTPGALQAACLLDCATARPAFVTKLNAAGSGLAYSTFLTSGDGAGLAIRLDTQGRAYVLGNSASFQTTPAAFEPAGAAPPPWANPTSPVNAFLASLSVDGSSLVYGTFISGALVLDVDASGDAYVAGNAHSGFPVSAGAFENCYDNNLYAAEFSPAGALLGATYFGAPGADDAPNGIAVGPNGQVSIGANEAQIVFLSNLLINDPRQTDNPCVSPVVQNAASYYSYGNAIAPGEMITLQGVGIGPETGVSGTRGANGLLPTELAGVQVSFDELAAPLLYVQSGQINVAVPWEIAGRTSTQVQVEYNRATLNPFGLQVQQAMPGLFYLSYPSSQGAILNADGSINSPGNPAKAGDVISLFGTGAGPTTPAGVTGGFSELNANTLLTLPVTVQIGPASPTNGNPLNAPVIYAGAAPGLLSTFFQINAQVPSGIAPNSAAYIYVYFGPPSMPVASTLYQSAVTVAVQ